MTKELRCPKQAGHCFLFLAGSLHHLCTPSLFHLGCCYTYTSRDFIKIHRNLLNEYFNGRINLQVNYTPNFVLFPFVGFIFVDDLLKLRQFQRYSEDDIKRVVADNDKKRFALRNDPETDRLQVRANQGHTMEVGILVNPHGTDMTRARKFVVGEPLSIHRC